jgi:hypothetical protein
MWAVLLCAGLSVIASGRQRGTVEQEVEGRSDFDFVPPNQSKPTFRLLAPETSSVDGVRLDKRLMHTITGTQIQRADGLGVELSIPGKAFTCVIVRPQTSWVDVEYSVTNRDVRTWKNVTAEFCLGLNRLPSQIRPWSNAEFFPGALLDRSVQGAYWFSVLTPQRLQCYSAGQWVGLHPRPEDPDPAKFPRYPTFAASDKLLPSSIIVLRADDSQPQFFMMWSKEGYARPPFPGNACMHLASQLAGELKPGETATIRGKAGFWGSAPKDLLPLQRQLAPGK